MTIDFRSRLGAVALHESGHAIAVYHSPALPAVRQVIINGPNAGAHTHLDAFDEIELSEAAFYQALRALAAGCIAEAISGERPEWAGGDAAAFSRLVALRALWRAGWSRSARQIEAELRSSELVARDAGRDAVLLLRARWAEVELVATRLLGLGDLNGALLASTIQRAQRRPALNIDDAERLFDLIASFEGRQLAIETALRQMLAAA
jgi:hypothetical protein